jgi:hypothetical protein
MLTQSQCSQTPFQRAWQEYVAQLPPKKKQRRFLMNCARAIQDRSDDSPASAINDAISAAEKKHSMQPSRRVIRKYIEPVINVLRDFDAIISTLSRFQIRSLVCIIFDLTSCKFLRIRCLLQSFGVH